jgi:hypothetical protein
MTTLHWNEDAALELSEIVAPAWPAKDAPGPISALTPDELEDALFALLF